MNSIGENQYYPKIKDKVVKICQENNWSVVSTHLLKTVDWVEKLRPDADEGLLIAAVSHDIERIYKDKDSYLGSDLTGKSEAERKKYHQEKSAEIVARLLEEEDAPAELIDRVKMLVSKHEVGGNVDQNLLMDADSISFLENNVEFFVNEMVRAMGKEKVKWKFDWMFNRIVSPEAKKIARPMCDKAINLLESK